MHDLSADTLMISCGLWQLLSALSLNKGMSRRAHMIMWANVRNESDSMALSNSQRGRWLCHCFQFSICWKGQRDIHTPCAPAAAACVYDIASIQTHDEALLMVSVLISIILVLWYLRTASIQQVYKSCMIV